MSSHIRQQALAFMASRHSVTLASVGADGLLISPAFFVLCDDFDFWFIAEINSRFDPATIAAGIVQSNANDPEETEVRIDGFIEPVENAIEQAKALSAFLLHAIDLSDRRARHQDGQPFLVHRMNARRVHFRSPALLRHTAVFHLVPPVREPIQRRPRHRKFNAIRQNATPTVPADRPTLIPSAVIIPKPSIIPPS